MAATTELTQEDTAFSATDINTILVALKLLQDDLKKCDSQYFDGDNPVEVLSEDEIDELCEALRFNKFGPVQEDKAKVLVTLSGDGEYTTVYCSNSNADVKIFNWGDFNHNPKDYHDFFSAEFAELAEQAGIHPSCVQSESSGDDDSPCP